MTALTITTIVLTITILLFVQKITIRVILLNGYSITVDYFLITLTLKKSDQQTKRRAKRYRPSIRSMTRALVRIVRSSSILINKINPPLSSTDPFRSAIERGGAISGIYPFLNLLISYAGSTHISKGAFVTERNTAESVPTLDIVLSTQLYNIAFSGILLLYEELKRRITQSNVRKSNE